MTATRHRARTAVAIVVLALLAALFVYLGAWQLRRADENRALAEQFAGGDSAKVLGDPPALLTDANRFHRVEVRGAYLAAPQFLLDNMLHDGVAGYHVLTALRVEGSTRRLIVNRGWVGSGSDRRTLPDVSASTEPRTITGRIERLPQPGIRLGEPAAPASTPTTESVAVVEYPAIADLAAQLGQPLFDYQLLLDPAEPGGYARDWQAPGVSPERNVVYAGQWLLFGVGALGAALTLAIKMLRRRL
ncbi:MAG: SURF1 family protein [Gammaproteobacteria bacterium]